MITRNNCEQVPNVKGIKYVSDCSYLTIVITISLLMLKVYITTKQLWEQIMYNTVDRFQLQSFTVNIWHAF